MLCRLTALLAVTAMAVPLYAGPTSPTAAQRLADADNRFAFDLYGELAGDDGNVFYSPYSVQSALAMTMAGANGPTADEMYSAMNLPTQTVMVHAEPKPGLPQPWSEKRAPWSAAQLHGAAAELSESLRAAAGHEKIALSIANSIFPAASFDMKPGFVSTLKQDYGVTVTPVAFPDPGRVTINTWVAEQTNDRIKDLLKPGTVDGATRLVLVNAIYFKGAWRYPFNAGVTHDRAFHLSADEQAAVPTMYQRQRFAYAEDDTSQLVELPYAGNKLSMVVLLPREGTSPDKLMEGLTAESWSKRLSQARRQEVDVYLPKFKVEYARALNGPLQSLGMKLAFTPDADFGKMSDEGQLYISLVQHQAFVEVNEEGSEAAAATAVVLLKGSAKIPSKNPPVFRADRPFIYAIRDVQTGAILFMGRLNEPRG